VEKMKFLDQVKIYIKSGDGGAGACSFRREKFIEYGGPDGGNGGRGGDITVVAVDELNTLIDYRYQQHFRAQIGHHGMGRNRTGKDGESIIMKVPVGTQIFDEDKETLLADMLEPGQTVLLARGGDGGFGNAHYKSATNRAPRKFTPGWPGEERWIWMQLKLIADAGLVGLPNAGKSTFLSTVSRAKPKIADYPFTTLIPQLGVVYIHDKEFVLADLPGLIEDAHLGAGLGDRFLGHVERCGVLLHLIDGSAEDVAASYTTIRHELKEYGRELSQKPEVIGLNKCDLLDDDQIQGKIAALKEISKSEVFVISAATQQGIPDLLSTLLKHILKDREGKKRASAVKDEGGYHPLG
jgi:GTP-binding protein